jgi:hypothetical protein
MPPKYNQFANLVSTYVSLAALDITADAWLASNLVADVRKESLIVTYSSLIGLVSVGRLLDIIVRTMAEITIVVIRTGVTISIQLANEITVTCK